jgi:hypothetical protein
MISRMRSAVRRERKAVSTSSIREAQGRVRDLLREKGRVAQFFPVVPGMMKIQGGAMVDQPQLLIPDQHIGIAGGAVYVGEQAIQPDDLGGGQRVDRY